MTEAKDKKTKSGQSSQAQPYERCSFMDARDMFWRFAEAFGPPEDVADHFRQARIEVLKGMRELLDHRIATLSQKNRKGTRVTVE